MAQGELVSFAGLSIDQAREALSAFRNRRDEQALSVLMAALGASHWQVRKEAADLLVAVGAQAAEPLKQTFMAGSEDQRYWVMNILARILGRECLPWLRKLYASKDHGFRAYVLSAVSVVSGPEAAQVLMEALEDDSWLNRVAAAGYLEKRGKEVLKYLQKGFTDGSGDMKYWCLRLLVQILGHDAAGFLHKGLQNEDPNIRHYVIRSMEDVQEEWVMPLLVEALADSNWANRKQAATILQLRGKRSLLELIECLKSENLDVVYWAIKALSAIGDERALKPLESLLHKHTSPQVIEWGIGALASFRSSYSARVLLEASYEFPQHCDFIRGKLLEFGIKAVRPLLEYTRSPNRELQTFARGILLDLGFSSMPALMKNLDNSPANEYDGLLEDLNRIPEDRLSEALAGRDVDLGALQRLASSIESRVLPSLSTLNIKLRPGDVQQLKKLTKGGAAAEVAPPAPAEPGIDDILTKAVEAEASDIHVKSNLPPIFRIQGVLRQTDLPPTPPEQMRRIMLKMAGEARLAEFERRRELDLAYEIKDVSRFRVNFYSELDGPGVALRVIPGRVLSLADLKLSKTFKDICNSVQGLILVTGPTGVGKSTTLAAMLDYINATREEHIITIEDPVEFRHHNKKSIITYRELGTNTESFSNALRGALRQDPDVILVGEMRDRETMQLALTAAETGHLVLSTLHTTSAAETVDRMLSVFPPESHDVVTKSLADSLRAIISQLLVPTVDGRRTVVMEILVRTYAVANLIREGKLNQIDQAIIAGRDQGMQSRDDHLELLCRERVITKETALLYCQDKNELGKRLRVVA